MPTPFLHTLSARLAFFGLAALLSAVILAIMLHYLQHEAPQSSTETAAPSVQHITAPLVVIPYVDHFVSVETVTDKSGESKVVSKNIYTDHTAVLLPDLLTIRVTLNADHTGVVILTGKMDYQNLIAPNGDNQRNIRWDKATLQIGVKDLTALKNEVKVFWDDDHMELESDVQALPNLEQGFHVKLPETKETAAQRYHTFEIQLPIQLGSRLTFTPTGQQTSIEANLTNPLMISPFGAISPSSMKNTSATTAQWRWEIMPLVRGYPSYWIQDEVKPFDLHQAAVGFEFKIKSNQAQLVWTRLIHWAGVILTLVLGLLLGLELMTGKMLHWLQYTVCGISISLWYLLLMANEAFWPFVLAFQISSGAVIGFITLIMGLLLGTRAAALIALLLTALFYTLYLLATLPAYGLISMVALSAIIMLMLIIGSMRYKQNSPSLESETIDS